jgi:hypothetical protein
MAAMKLELGKYYSRNEIYGMVGGGSKQSYLPERDGKILCGCFDPKLNSKAPCEIDAGNGPKVLGGAKRLAENGNSIPVFLKRKSNQWEFVGDYVSTGFSEDPEDLYPKKQRRPNAVAVLYLKRIFESEEKAAVDLLAQEGNKALRIHFIKERDPSLAAAKRRTFIEQHGFLFCEACGVGEKDFPEGLGQSCFEIHHLFPIGERLEPKLTRLSDLAVVCANCHRMIHAKQSTISLEEMKKRLVLHKPL